MAITWQRGFFRLWIGLSVVLAVLWVAAVVWAYRRDESMQTMAECSDNPYCWLLWPMVLAGPPLVFLVIGLAAGWLVRWVATGFHRS